MPGKARAGRGTASTAAAIGAGIGNRATLVVLLRGVNVGRANRITMADFRTVLETCGLSDVRTVLASGNAIGVLPGPRPAAAVLDLFAHAIEVGLAKQGVRTPVTLLTAASFARIVDANPLAELAAAHPTRFLVAFPRTRDELQRLTPLAARDWGVEQCVAGPDALYLSCPDGLAESPLGAAVSKAAAGVTARNWNTVLRLLGTANR